MSQGAEKSQPSEVGIEPWPQDLKANTLPPRCKSRLLPQGSRSELYTYTYYIFPCFKLIRPGIYSEPRCNSWTFPSWCPKPKPWTHILATKCHRVQKNPNWPRWESNRMAAEVCYICISLLHLYQSLTRTHSIAFHLKSPRSRKTQIWLNFGKNWPQPPWYPQVPPRRPNENPIWMFYIFHSWEDTQSLI